MVEKYDALLKHFVTNNMATLLASRRYKEPKEGKAEYALHYLPEHNKTPDPGFIGETPQFNELLETFIDTFINLETISFQMQGHFPELNGRSVAYVIENVRSYKRDIIRFEYEYKLLLDVFHAFLGIRDNTKINYFMFSYGHNQIEFQSTLGCPSCNEYLSMIIDYDKMGVVSLIKKPDCPLAAAPKNVVVELKSPSGKLVFLNDPRQFLKIERDNRYKVSINSTMGCLQETEAYAEQNVGYFFIGNCMPYIFQKGNEILFSSFNEESDEDIEHFKEYEELGYVCTGLWWYSILDHQLFLDLCASKGVNPASIEHTVAITNKETFTVDHDMTAHKEGHFSGTYSTITY
jgi:hypothetical protein